MKKSIVTAALVIAAASTGFAQTTSNTAAAPADLEMWRLDCGSIQVNDLNQFSDTKAYTGKSYTLTASCYLIRHGKDYLLWDAGLPEALLGAPQKASAAMAPTLTTTVVSQLKALGLAPEEIGRVGISHYHFDHIGQAAHFAQATLLIGDADLQALKSGNPDVDAKPLAPWITGSGKTQAVKGDKDVFGDGSVTMLALPGHTPGHTGLLVRLAKTGPVLLSGDVAHFTQNLATSGVPTFNTNRADSLASMDRFRKLGESLKATVILQHEPTDVSKLPAFPASAN